ncbi:hypothetical protein Q73A0000_13530 [Kaistella flava (ex Peng et al. 2021)]|uniref:CBM6 domain-containing protein n=1 Tax=Kaistella flava (ex Peng et al. 2021) TaxID=2038776 RepID=A0A7M2YAK8_9FLAO|nr:hypothetical protein [Kaistella flava (ex Peng et al. 2021)]QOW11307.1 hypothetical protein Q73A0000_13530 [Kaistella flava (ex Peng et al. 2021)]
MLTVAFAKSQYVGINTTNPKATFDIVGTPNDVTKADGLIPPRITLAQLNAKTSYSATQKGALIYVTDLTGGSTVSPTAQVTATGYYYFNGMLWESVVPKSVIFTASLGENASITQGAFNTVPLKKMGENLGGGVWDSTNYTYSVPVSGTYIIKSTIRLADGFGSRNIFQAVNTSNSDNPDGIWQTNPGTQRWTMLYTRIAYFNKGDLLRLYIYSDGGTADLINASLNIALLNQN